MQAVRSKPVPRAKEAVGILLFSTDLGWVAMQVNADVIMCLTFGYASPMEALKGLDVDDFDVIQPNAKQKKWIKRLERFAAGDVDELRDVPLDESHYTAFQHSVIAACRAIPYGKTLSYGELAEQAGSPRAARAVGNVMRSNRFPLIVPCHRVVASQGMGGYSGVEGLTTKQRLLKMEHDSLEQAKFHRNRRKPR